MSVSRKLLSVKSNYFLRVRDFAVIYQRELSFALQGSRMVSSDKKKSAVSDLMTKIVMLLFLKKTSQTSRDR